MDIFQEEKDYSIVSAGYSFSSNNQDVSSGNNGYSDYWIVKSDTDIIYQRMFGADSVDQLAVLVPVGYDADQGYLLAVHRHLAKMEISQRIPKEDMITGS